MAIPCSRCGTLPLVRDQETSGETVCPLCGAESSVRVFPALYEQRDERASGTEAAEGEATCFDHPTKQAVAHCSQCGRFVCQLCAVDFRDGVWCPECMATGVSKKRTLDLERDRVLYDSIALLLATAPLLMWPLTLLTGPASVYVAIRYWKRPLSLVRATRWRMVLAAFIGAAQTAGWVWFAVYLTAKAGIAAK